MRTTKHPPYDADTPTGVIGEFIRRQRPLSEQQVEQIVSHQKTHGVRFGEAAVALELVSADDVVQALSRQFRYPYVPAEWKGSNELISARQPFSAESEVFREMRSQLLLGSMATGQPKRALALLSPSSGEGRSFVTANLAVTFSQLGGRTIVVDADMRRPRLQEMFGLVDGSAGLSTILSGRAERRMIQQVKDLPNLYAMPAGPVPPNPQELLQSPAFGMLIEELVRKFDYVLVDTPSMSVGSDARVVAARCGLGLVVGRKGVTRMDRLRELVKDMERISVCVAGVALNDH